MMDRCETAASTRVSARSCAARVRMNVLREAHFDKGARWRADGYHPVTTFRVKVPTSDILGDISREYI